MIPIAPIPELLAVAAVTVLAVVSPGPDFAMVTRNSYLYGRRAGLLSALGIALGVQVHVLYTMFGVAVLMAHAHSVLTVVKALGAAYLVWIGIQTLRNRQALAVDLQGERTMRPLASLRMGFLTNALNPKCTLFVVSTYTQVVDVRTPVPVQFGYGAFMSVAHWVWFSLVACVFTAPALRAAMRQRQRLLDRTIGSALCGLGVALGFSNLG
ncbi:LysE family translocator [Cupriavidus necator]|uniref:LysE family translocator n=1 Tax=Cupriavidus necator TaxID=106590 RepID=UPI0038B28F66